MGKQVATREQIALERIEEAYLNDALDLDQYNAEKRRVYEGTSRFLPAERKGLVTALIDGEDWAIERAIKIVAVVVVLAIVLGIVGSVVGGLFEVAGGGFGEGFEADD